MKKILTILLLIMIIGCTEVKEEMDDLDYKDIAEEYVLDSYQYKEYSGNNLEFAAKETREGKDLFIFLFDVDTDNLPENVIGFQMKVEVKDGKTKDVEIIERVLEIAEVTEQDCAKDSECETPMDYLIRSSCPYTSKCIDDRCTVVCERFYPEELIGGHQDKQGCLTGAGYSWDEDVSACIRTWELDDDKKDAAKLAISHLSFPVTIINVDILRCTGCYDVKVQRNDNRETFIINLRDGKITESPEMTEYLCTSSGGNWNECSSKCKLDNQGKEDAICTMQCEQLCECAGIAGFSCPEGFTCKIPKNLPDALGYCI